MGIPHTFRICGTRWTARRNYIQATRAALQVWRKSSSRKCPLTGSIFGIKQQFVFCGAPFWEGSMAYVDTAAIFSETAQLAVALAIGLEIRQTRTNQDLGQVLCQWSVFAHQVGVSSSLGRRLQAQIRQELATEAEAHQRAYRTCFLPTFGN